MGSPLFLLLTKGEVRRGEMETTFVAERGAVGEAR